MTGSEGDADTDPAGAREPAGAVVGLLLAAGGGRRLGGRPKALLRHRGRPLVEHGARALRDGGCEQVHVVLGAEAARVRAEAELAGCVLVDNPAWEEGMGSSLRAGLGPLAEGAGGGAGTAGRAAAVLVMLVDQPGIDAAAVARVRAAYRSPASLVSAAYDGRRGHPVLFGADHWAGVMADARGDKGARTYLAAHSDALTLVECADIADPYDIDTPEDLGRLDRET